MALKKMSGSGVGLATTANNGETTNAIDRHINDLRQRIAQRAFELCSQRGWMHGQDMEDWLRAESEVSTAAPIELIDNEDQYTIVAEVPGLTQKDLDISCEGNRVLIRGNAQHFTDTTSSDGRLVYSERQTNQVFRLIHLPEEINPDGAEAVVRDGLLELRLPKQSRKPTRVQVRAA